MILLSDKANKNRQHYVPKFYLRNFSDSEKAIASFNITNAKYIENASIRNMCQKNNFYGADNRVEDFFSEDIEGKAASIIKQIIQTSVIPREMEDYVHLLMFILVTEARNIKMNDSVNNMADFLSKAAISKNPEFKDIDLHSFKVNLDNGILMMIKAAIEMTPIISDLEAVVITENSNSRKFLASDNPVIRYNHFYLSRNYPGGFGLGTRGLMLFFPLSHEKCLLLYDNKVYNIPQLQKNELILNRARDIDVINQLIYLNSYNNIFAHQKIKESYLQGIHRNNLSVPKMSDIEREARKVKAVNLEGDVIHFSNNRVTKLLNFSWLKYTEYGKELIAPRHMGGIMREEAEFLAKHFVPQIE